MTKYLFIRHGQCHKNLEDVTGGEGSALTNRGISQARSAAAELTGRFPRPHVVACPATQTVETATIIAETLGCPATIDETLRPAGLGLLSGLTPDEAERLYPEYARLLRRWRNYEIEAHELKIPGIEPPSTFWNRAISSIRRHEGKGDIIVVATRSIMVLAANIGLNRTPEPGGGYRHVTIEHCQTVTVDI